MAPSRAAGRPVTPRPVLPGFHPDPSICRVGDTYWMVCSSFEYAPGVPLFRSTDLLSWEQVGNVLDRPDQLDVGEAPASGGITAPTLRWHDGRFFLITTNLADGGWQLLVHTEDPTGPWSDAVRIDAPGIDPDLAWDDDGRCLMSYAGFGAGGPAGLVQSEIDPFTGAVLTARRPLWQGTGGRFPEGPHLYRVGRWWYLLIAEGGTERGHAVTIARSVSPSGPFEPCPDNPLLTMRGVEGPVQNTGHADLVQRPDGRWAMVFHGVRPRGSSPGWHVLGRETFAAGITWADGWPVVGEWLQPGRSGATGNELAGVTLPASWVSPQAFPAEQLAGSSDGWRLRAGESGESFVGRRQEHLTMHARAEVETGSAIGGLSVRVDARHRLDVEVDGTRVSVVVQVGALRQVLGSAEIGSTAVSLVVGAAADDGHFSSTATGPDVLVGGYDGPGGFVELGRLDGRYVSTEVAGGMTGRLCGLYCSVGEILVRSFTYAGTD